MMVVTGAAGFIGSCLISRLNQDNFNYIIAVDDFSDKERNRNLDGSKIQEKVDRSDLFNWLEKNYQLVEFFFHTESPVETALLNNGVPSGPDYSKRIWESCAEYQIPLIYTSSAASYIPDEEEQGTTESAIPELISFTPYNDSRDLFDIWALQQEKKPFFWAGLKLFNVYGPNEYHKGNMASLIYNAVKEVNETGEVKLLRSYDPNYRDGEQKRDFIYVKDVTEVIMFFVYTREVSGIYNLGTGEARTHLDLAKCIFHSLGTKENITFMDIPENIREQYRYFSEAEIEKLRKAGYDKPFTSLEDGVEDYIKNYISERKYY